MSGARVERYVVDPEGESDQGVGITLHSYAPGPQPAPQPPNVSPELLDYLRNRFGKLPPETTNHQQIVVELAKVWGQLELIEHLSSLTPNKEK